MRALYRVETLIGQHNTAFLLGGILGAAVAALAIAGLVMAIFKF